MKRSDITCGFYLVLALNQDGNVYKHCICLTQSEAEKARKAYMLFHSCTTTVCLFCTGEFMDHVVM